MCLLLLYKQTHVHKRERAVHTNEEKYKEEIIKFIKEEKDEAYLRAVYTFAKNYPRSKKGRKGVAFATPFLFVYEAHH